MQIAAEVILGLSAMEGEGGGFIDLYKKDPVENTESGGKGEGAAAGKASFAFKFDPSILIDPICIKIGSVLGEGLWKHNNSRYTENSNLNVSSASKSAVNSQKIAEQKQGHLTLVVESKGNDRCHLSKPRLKTAFDETSIPLSINCSLPPPQNDHTRWNPRISRRPEQRPS
ncbi:hypothetical protein TB2_026683 [Malus domestica]